MKKEYIFGILFFSGLWGISEAVLGDALYRANVPYTSVPLTIIGFIVLSFATVYFPQKGTASIIAACAMLYKFVNAPFFGCHLLGIFMMGLSYDLFFSIFRASNKVKLSHAAPSMRLLRRYAPKGQAPRNDEEVSLRAKRSNLISLEILRKKNVAFSAAAATYLSYTLFALMITYIFKHDFWAQAGFSKVLRHVGIGGSMAALGCAVLVPLSYRIGEQLKDNFATPFRLRLQIAPGSISVLTIGLWAFSLVAYFIK